MHLSTKPEVKGTFQYILDDSEQSQPCVLIATVCVYANIFTFVNAAGSSGNDLLLPKLSAGVHCIVLKFTPTDLSETFSTSTKFQFEIEPTGHLIFSIVIAKN